MADYDHPGDCHTGVPAGESGPMLPGCESWSSQLPLLPPGVLFPTDAAFTLSGSADLTFSLSQAFSLTLVPKSPRP